MKEVYICYIEEDVKYDKQGQILGVFEEFNMACEERDNFNEKYSYMVAQVIRKEIIKCGF